MGKRDARKDRKRRLASNGERERREKTRRESRSNGGTRDTIGVDEEEDKVHGRKKWPCCI